MMAEMLAGFLADLARQPALLLAAIFAASLRLEDAAIVAAGLLAAHMIMTIRCTSLSVAIFVILQSTAPAMVAWPTHFRRIGLVPGGKT